MTFHIGICITPIRSEESYKLLLPFNLTFITLYKTANNNGNIICHSEAQRRISQLLANTDFEILHFDSE